MDLSIYELEQNIYNSDTKQNFKEVLSSYNNSNYRSAIVMLYSVAITDILYKLTELKDVYSDTKAIQILKILNDKRSINPNSADWELELIKQIKLFDNNIFLDKITISNLEYVRGLRHISAHPALDNENKLYTPNQETTLACIKNVLDGILIKPPYFIKNIIDNISEYISKNQKAFFNDYDAFKSCIKNRYLDHMNTQMIIKSFNAFWKFTFYLTNKDCCDNRRINLKFLNFIFSQYSDNILNNIEENQEKYSQVNINDDETKAAFYVFLNKNTKIFQVLSQHLKKIITADISGDERLKNLFYFYDNQSLSEHLIHCDASKLKNSDLIYYLGLAKKERIENLVYDKMIDVFTNASSYSESNIKFDELIKPYIKNFSLEQLEKLVEGINSNTQNYERIRAKEDNTIIYLAITSKNSNFDFTRYEKFKFDEKEDDIIDNIDSAEDPFADFVYESDAQNDDEIFV